ncbi:MAG: hypothetical protein Q4A21_00020 [bacterium]|nr:hypothetical protein [bacterium]
MTIPISTYRKLVDFISRDHFDKKMLAMRMIAYSYPDSVIIEYLGSETIYNTIYIEHEKKIANLTEEIRKQLRDSRMFTEEYFDGYEAIAQVYGLSREDIINLAEA